MGMMMNQMQQNKSTEDDIEAKLLKLKKLFDNGLIEEDEYKTKKSDLLDKL